MAYMTKDGKGPYACYAGEFLGNFHSKDGPLAPGRLKHQRVGLPRPYAIAEGSKTTAELASEGWVGLYLKEDTKCLPSDVLVDTPDELREPKP